MDRTIFVKEIIMVLEEPDDCPNCNKGDRLEHGIVREDRSGGKTVLCTRCEALIIITNHNLKSVELSSPSNDSIMLKEPHLIRRVTY